MKIIILSDVHANILRCQDIALRHPDCLVVQIGDLGVGFVPREVIENLPRNFTFFCGNHDNRQIANSLDSCLGDYGLITGGKIFFVSGANSKDQANRTEGVNWWRDEELSMNQCDCCLDSWKSCHAEVLLSHDLPQEIAENYYLIYDRSRTRQLLDRMTEERRPKFHFFGHHHKPFHVNHKGTEYYGLKIDEAFLVDMSAKGVTVTPI